MLSLPTLYFRVVTVVLASGKNVNHMLADEGIHYTKRCVSTNVMRQFLLHSVFCIKVCYTDPRTVSVSALGVMSESTKI